MSPRHVPATQAELSRIGLLAELPGERLVELAQRMRREDVASGDAPVVEGERGERFYVVLNGVFAVSNLGSMPRRMLRPGDYFGEVALAMDIPRTASVRAMMPSTVASCDRATFDEFLRPLFAD
ncbi:MAG: cyclic nucleotide-binding domain-containing protein [Gaiellaceae bacterium]